MLYFYVRLISPERLPNSAPNPLPDSLIIPAQPFTDPVQIDVKSPSPAMSSNMNHYYLKLYFIYKAPMIASSQY